MPPQKRASGGGVPESSAELCNRRGSGRRFHRRGHHLGVHDHGGQQHRGEQLPAGPQWAPAVGHRFCYSPLPPPFFRQDTPHARTPVIARSSRFYNHISPPPKVDFPYFIMSGNRKACKGVLY